MSVRPAETRTVGGVLRVVAELDEVARGAVDVAFAYVVGLLQSGCLVRAGLKTTREQLFQVRKQTPVSLTLTYRGCRRVVRPTLAPHPTRVIVTLLTPWSNCPRTAIVLLRGPHVCL
jgi:hypothetical protein